MDELDQRIIGLLQMDGRASNAALARELGVTEGTIRRRLRRLIQEGLIRITALPNIEKMGYGTTALVGVQTRPGKADDVAEALARLEEVHYAAVTTGAFDVFLFDDLPVTARVPSCVIPTNPQASRHLSDFLETSFPYCRTIPNHG